MTVHGETPNPRRRSRELAFALSGVVAGLVLIEGLASVALFVRDSLAEGRLFALEDGHARFDPVLGWVSLPNVRRPDQYGPGISLSTNSRGFRGARETETRVPAGRVRVVCSGDSFTLGYGVGDEETWPALLESLDGRIETVNMGEGGYGLDQTYLRYARDGVAIEHHAHVVAFITDDLTRMQRSRSVGFAKPQLTLHGGELVVTNVPLAKASRIAILWVENAHLLTKLRTVALLRRILGRDGEVEVASVEALGPVAVRLFEDLAERHSEESRVLLCVYLPTAQDYAGDRGTDRWRGYLAAELAARHPVPRPCRRVSCAPLRRGCEPVPGRGGDGRPERRRSLLRAGESLRRREDSLHPGAVHGRAGGGMTEARTVHVVLSTRTLRRGA